MSRLKRISESSSLLPVELVSGVDCDQIASYLIAQQRPSFLLVNDASVRGMPLVQTLSSPAFVSASGVQALTSVGGCACCTSSVAMRVELSRMIRAAKGHCALLRVVTNHWEHAGRLLQLLSSAPFDQHVVLHQLTWIGDIPASLESTIDDWRTNPTFEQVSTNIL